MKGQRKNYARFIKKKSKILADHSMNLITEQDYQEQKKEQEEWGFMFSDVLQEIQNRECTTYEADAGNEEQQRPEEASSEARKEEEDQTRDHLRDSLSSPKSSLNMDTTSGEDSEVFLEECGIDSRSLVNLRATEYFKDGSTKPFRRADFDSREGCVIITLPQSILVVQGIEC